MSEGAAAAPPGKTAPGRLEWLDLYRGLAVLVMIETHVFNTFLTRELQASEWYGRMTFFNGLVAPSFLFIAGYAQGLGWKRSQKKHGILRRRLRRLGVIVLIGYALHFPWADLMAGRWEAALRVGTQVDILPCLAVALVLLVIVERWAGNGPRWIVGAAVAGAVFAAFPFSGWTEGPVPLVAYVNQTTGSMFPLFPWAAFAFAGWLLAGWGRPALICGAVVLPCWLLAWVLPRFEPIRVNPSFFFERLGWVVLLVPIVAGVARWWRPAWVRWAGSESLSMYVTHLLLISAFAGWGGFKNLTVPQAGAMLAVVLALSFALSWGWRRLTVWRADRARAAAV